MNQVSTPVQTMVVLPASEWEKIQAKLDGLESLLLQNQECAFRNQWVESEVARKQVGVCPRTWQAMRDKRVIPFSQYGRKIYFRQGDIDAFLEGNMVSAK